MNDRDDPGAWRHQTLELLDLKLTRIVDGGHLQMRLLLLAEHLPGNDVGMMLHVRDQDLITRAHVRAPVCLCDEVDRFGRTPDKDNLTVVGGVEEPAHL